MRIAILALVLLPQAAAAEWRYDPGFGPAGRALGFGSGGQSIAVECGNGGLPAVVMHGPRPVGGAQEDYVLRVDDLPELLLGAECSSEGCFVMFDEGAQVRSLLQALRAGRVLSVGFFRRGQGGEIPLEGSSAAIGSVMAAGCEMP